MALIAERELVTTEQTRKTAGQLFADLADGRAPEELAAHFADDIDWFIPGDVDTVPWIGRKRGRAGVAEFYRQLQDLVVAERFEIRAILAEAERCVVLGDLVTVVRATGRRIESEFAFDIEVRDGLITRYHMLEDTWAVARACRDNTET